MSLRYGIEPTKCVNWIEPWIEDASTNEWIAMASDPPFDKDSFAEVSVEDLWKAFQHGNWSLGVAFCIHYGGFAFAFINQINGGDEWLVYRESIPFESVTAMSCWPKHDGELETDLARWARATPEQLRKCEY